MTLTPREEANAVRYNRRKMAAVGWRPDFPRLTRFFSPQNVRTPELFAHSVHKWQSQNPPLEPDGKLGSKTWRRLRAALPNLGGATVPIPAWVGAAPVRPPLSTVDPFTLGGVGPLWYRVAQAQKRAWDAGMAGWSEEDRERPEEHVTWDEEYFAASPRWGNHTHDVGERPRANADWCAAFVNYCLHRAGYSHTGSAGAASFASRSRWHFNALEEPQVGCIIVLGLSSGSHVGFLADTQGLPSAPDGDVLVRDLPRGGVELLGGNQSQRVRYKHYSNRNLLAARGRNGVVSPYFKPLRGPATCNIDLSTAHPHHCHHPHTA